MTLSTIRGMVVTSLKIGPTSGSLDWMRPSVSDCCVAWITMFRMDSGLEMDRPEKRDVNKLKNNCCIIQQIPLQGVINLSLESKSV